MTPKHWSEKPIMKHQEWFSLQSSMESIGSWSEEALCIVFQKRSVDHLKQWWCFLLRQSSVTLHHSSVVKYSLPVLLIYTEFCAKVDSKMHIWARAIIVWSDTECSVVYATFSAEILWEVCKFANLVLASRNLERSVDRQQKLEKVMDEEGLPDEEVTNTHT